MQRNKIWDSLDAFKRAILSEAGRCTEATVLVIPMVTDDVEHYWDVEVHASYQRALKADNIRVDDRSCYDSKKLLAAPKKRERADFVTNIHKLEKHPLFLDLSNGLEPKKLHQTADYYLDCESVLEIAGPIARADHWLAFYQTAESGNKHDTPNRKVFNPLITKTNEKERSGIQALVVDGGSAVIAFLASEGIIKKLKDEFVESLGSAACERVKWDDLSE